MTHPTKRKLEKVLVSEKALYQRINRKLRAQGETLHRSRGGRCAIELGEYYTVNTEINGVVDSHLDLEDFGRELGVLRPYEALREVR
jgi:hypothetical protein